MKYVRVDELDFEKSGGLIPVVAYDGRTKEVLMLAYANKEAVERTLTSGYAHYFSRSRNKIWMKGETSGNVQRVLEVLVDCDNDSLIYVVEQEGVACHTGNRTCFFRKLVL
ncbi:MAG: phosphoribosyl-AMP cyclohydrolase [Thaumarchaeota archaeon]|jgi:phosphoribosyl-AMP cyclohydrolase|nr:phosphoribosyl-AMP cyclohydrolase [Candidatus Terraquivivens yellowstonensis]MCL7387500.1 phosphoribosyl-AMP cyclohydrolase [Candidatus Terraquivivens yellowstonensis]MCL7392158.1 phosphoribosyl-AMP cyclohydrolase [Candidatus Terraquivivens yellowstonensis]MCL7397960.1 phosphoribosyl-AMP cyclohydrolase [Candidatus Terraquivivens yellowstonensis]MCL7399348.1 phosphoribosyl-AMP cyclohydrolase [Candidatus Terraquivivens yellowstonensis]